MRVKGDDGTLEVREMLLVEHSRAQTEQVVEWIGSDAKRFAQVVRLMLGDERKVAQRAAWVVGVAGERWPRLAARHLEAMLDHLRQPGLHPAVPRAVFRLLQTVPVSGALEARVIEVAFAALGGPDAVAVKAFAITVLKRFTSGQPELVAEIRSLIREVLPDSTPAIRVRARREFGIRE